MGEDGRQTGEQRRRNQARCVAGYLARPGEDDDERQDVEGEVADAGAREVSEVLAVPREELVPALDGAAARLGIPGVEGEQDPRQRRMLDLEVVAALMEPLVAGRDMNRLVDGLGEDAMRRGDPDDRRDEDRDQEDVAANVTVAP